MKKLLILGLLVIPTLTFAGNKLGEPHGSYYVGKGDFKRTPPPKFDAPWHIGDPIRIDDPSPRHWGDGIEHPPHHHEHHGHHNHDHIFPLCSCIGIDHIPFDRLKIHQLQD